MSLRYAVDSDVLAILQRAGHAASVQRLGLLPVVITDIVWDELTERAAKSNARPETVRETEALLKAIAGAPTVLTEQGPESQTLVELQRPPETEGLGEHSVIAYAYHHPDVVAVLHDRRALHRAVEELQGRVLSLHGFLDVLRARHGLAPRAANEVSSWYCARHQPQRPPVWW